MQRRVVFRQTTHKLMKQLIVMCYPQEMLVSRIMQGVGNLAFPVPDIALVGSSILALSWS